MNQLLHWMIGRPYIIAYNNNRNTFAWSGAISPDGRWFAVPEGLRTSGGRVVYHYELDYIQIYSTDGRREKHSIEIETGIFTGSNLAYSSVEITYWLSNEEFVYPVFRDQLERLNAFNSERNDYTGDYEPAFIRFQNSIRLDDERVQVAHESIGNEVLYIAVIDNPFDIHFAVRTNTTLLIGNNETQTFTDLCIQTTGMAFSPSGEIVISTEDEILVIQNDSAYRIAYHDGTVFDWRFPED